VSFDDEKFLNLPEAWRSIPVSEACSLVSPKSKIKQKLYLTSGKLPIVDQGVELVGGFTDDLNAVASTDLPVIVFGDHTRALKYVDFPFAAGADGIKILRPISGFHPRLFYHFLRAIRLPNKGYARHFQHLRGSRIALPPKEEQKLIADKLDRLLAAVDTCKARLDAIPAILKRFRQSVLAAATSGELTEEWRRETVSRQSSTYLGGVVPLVASYKRLRKKQSLGASPVAMEEMPELPSTWCYASVNELYASNLILDYADGNHGSFYPRKEEFGEQGVLFVTAAQIQEDGGIDKCGAPRLNMAKARQLNKGWAKDGDVLLTHNATVGRVAMAQGINEEFLLGTSVTFYRTNPTYLDPLYLYFCFRSDTWQQQLKAVMQQTTRDQVSIQKQALFLLPLPPIEEQKEIARRLKAVVSSSNNIERSTQSSRYRAEALTQSLLGRAFRGELGAGET
jgi:type I restriction enzyme, S subunit